ncbi:MAG: hypothetical protein XD98_0119 [Microgenomates bacterium 39_6]|nr:MAG: hypothetical protein XD98_0119 [Microgenomates bacterium 39_6]
MSQKKVFLAVAISVDRVRVVFWTYSNRQGSESIDFLAKGSEEVYLDQEELLAAVEASYKEAWFMLPEDGRHLLDRVPIVFAVPQYWVGESDQIDKSFSGFLKKIINRLQGQSLGFVPEGELLLNYFKNQEDDGRVNLVAVSVGEEKLVVFPIIRGQILGVEVVERSESIALDLEEGLARFDFNQPFPPRILLLGQEDLDEVRGDLLAYPWVETEPKPLFAHLPKVDTFSYQKVFATLANQAKDFLPEKTLEKESADQKEDQGRDEIDLSSEESIPKEETGALGFVKNQDIASLEKSFSEKEDLTSLPDDQEEPEKERKLEKLAIFSKLKNYLARIKGPKFKVPSREAKGNRQLPKGLLFVLIGVVFLLGVLGAIWWYFPKAEIVLSVAPKYSQDETSLLVAVGESEVKVEEKVIPARRVEVVIEKEGSARTTGEKLVGDKATGEVIIYNRTTIEKTFEKGTSLVSDGGLEFLTEEEVTVDPAEVDVDEDYNQITTPSKKAVAVKAVDIGQDYNLPAGEEFEVTSFIKENFVAKNEEAFSGGSSREAKVVTKKDQENLKDQLLSLIESQGKERLAEQLSPGEKLIDQSLEVNLKKEDFSHVPDEETEQLSLTVEVVLTGLAYREEDLNRLTEELLKQQVPSGFVLGTEKKVDFKFVEEQDGGALFDLSFGASLYPEIDENEVKKKVAGKRLNTIKDYLSLLPSVDGFEVRFSPPMPDFLLTLPHRTDNITITMEQESK